MRPISMEEKILIDAINGLKYYESIGDMYRVKLIKEGIILYKKIIKERKNKTHTEGENNGY